MGPYIGRRLLQMVPLVFGISIVLFTVIQMAPGGPEGSLLAAAKTAIALAFAFKMVSS